MKIKVLVEIDNKEVEQNLVINSTDEYLTLKNEMEGLLYHMPEFITDKGESISGSQIVRIIQ